MSMNDEWDEVERILNERREKNMCGQHENKLEGNTVWTVVESQGAGDEISPKVFSLKGKAIAYIVKKYSPTSDELNDLFKDGYVSLDTESMYYDTFVCIEEKTIE